MMKKLKVKVIKFRVRRERESCKNGVNDSRAPLLALGHTHTRHTCAREREALCVQGIPMRSRFLPTKL